MTPFLDEIAIAQWDKLEDILTTSTSGTLGLRAGTSRIRLDSKSLDLASIVAVSRYGAQAYLDGACLSRLSSSTKNLEEDLAEGKVIYGVYTGFGGSANTRISHVTQLQQTLVRELHYGILADPRPTTKTSLYNASRLSDDQMSGKSMRERLVPIYENGLPLDDPVTATYMPESWVRAAILICINSLVSGHSGVREVVVKRMLDLVGCRITPRIPLRGSISASGDLSPLSYVGGVLQGKPTLTVWADGPQEGSRQIMTAKEAFAAKSLAPVHLEAKEGLAIVNGTAISCAVGTLAISEAQNLAFLSQILTAMSVEALIGSVESFDPMFASLRPHPGQVESARSISCFLSGSRLTAVNDGSDEGSLRQDRYSIRTASQWLGPSLEDLALSHQQMTTECNSVTDNPLINERGRMLHGGNFQAKAVTSAMDKTRLALQSIGQMLFTQCTELIKPATNRGLPPNLVADEPGESFIFKGTNIMVAALQSELGFPSNPAGTYLQPAEMGNQALNSLALISARYTHGSVDVLSQLAACHLVALCQALDLRAMHARILDDFKEPFCTAFKERFDTAVYEPGSSDLIDRLWKNSDKQLGQTMTMDSAIRIEAAIGGLQLIIMTTIATEKLDTSTLMDGKYKCTVSAISSYRTTREAYLAHPDATALLGHASKQLYGFVRHELGVPFLLTERLLKAEILSPTHKDSHGKGGSSEESAPRLADTVEPTSSNGTKHLREGDLQDADDSAETASTVGSFNARVHHAIRTGRLFATVMDCAKDLTRGVIVG